MTNRSDLFDEPDEPARDSPQNQADPPHQASPPEDRPQGQPSERPPVMDRALSRRGFLRGAGAAAVGGAVVGAGAAVGLGALDGDGAAQADITEREGMSLGAPDGRLVSQAVVKLKVNGVDRWVAVDANDSLAEILRRKLGLTGTKIGCDRSECSACTVIVNGAAMNSCSMLAIREDGSEITTIEGLEQNGQLSPVQQAFLDDMGLQCGFCTPGQIMQATALLQHVQKPTEADVRRAMSGNLCKCSAYPNILAAVMHAAEKTGVL